MRLQAAKTAGGVLAIIDCPALLEASRGADHKLEAFFLVFFYGRHSVPNLLTFSLSSSFTSAGVSGP